jgi:arylsulfatase A-like enzyme
MFYQGDEFNPENKSLQPVYDFKPFRDFFGTWFPPGCTDADYIEAQYDGAIAYMDACIQILFKKLAEMELEEDTLVVFTSDHGETLNEHDCYFDHHGLYDCTLTVPFAFKFKGRMTGGVRIPEICSLADVTPTILKIMGIETGINFDGRDMTPLLSGGTVESETEHYITECTWQRKHGWRTPKYKYFIALEPDFHYKPEVELYDLENDPQELINIAEARPDLVKKINDRMLAFIAKREKETGRKSPIYTNPNWSGKGKYFETSDEAYNSLHIGDPEAARRLQDKAAKKQG